MVNPFDAILERLDSIDQRFIDLVKICSNSKVVNEIQEQDAVEAVEAAKILHLGMDRFYAIHKTLFNSVRVRKRLIFSKKELMAYMAGETIILKDPGISKAEGFRTTRLKKKLHMV